MLHFLFSLRCCHGFRGRRQRRRSRTSPVLVVFEQDGINLVECGIHVGPAPASGQHDFSGNENEQHHFGVLQPKHQAREKLRFVGAKESVFGGHHFQTNGERNAGRADNVLDSEIFELGGIAQLDNNLCKSLGSTLGSIFVLCTSNNNLNLFFLFLFF